jgi:phosphatidylglycerophosphatase A
LDGFGFAPPLGLSFEAFLKSPYVVGTLFLSLMGVWASQHSAEYLHKNDPGEVVIDEIAGQLIAYAPIMLPAFFEWGGWKYILLGFILFRVFDIWKPYPIRRLEKLPGGWGIMADDWLAGVYAAVVLWVIRWAEWIG